MIFGICLTHSRPAQLGNVIACWERQSYQGPRFLLVLDDGDTVAPAKGATWEIVSTRRRFAGIGQKRAAAMNLALQMGATSFAVWDDDDAFLDHHLESCVVALEKGNLAIPSVVFSDYQEPELGGVHLQASGRRHHSAWAFTAELYRRSGGYDHAAVDKGEDKRLLLSMERAGAKIVDPTNDFPPSYWYRWTHSGSRHVSASGWWGSGTGRFADGKASEIVPGLQQDWNGIASRIIGPLEDWPRRRLELRDDVRPVREVQEGGKLVPRAPGPLSGGKPRVAFISPTCTMGGAEEWFRLLAQKSRDVQFVGAVILPFRPNLVDPGMVREYEKVCPVQVGAEHVRPLLEKSDVAIVWGTPEILPELESWKGKVIFAVHGQGEWTRQRAEQYEKRADVFVAVSEAAASSIPARRKAGSLVIHNGIESARLFTMRSRNAIREMFGIEEGQIAIGYCGRFSDEKNPMAAAEGCNSLPGSVALYQVPSLSLPLAMREIPKLIGDRVRWGNGNVADFYKAADVLVMGSKEEGFSLAIAEAWTAGVPIVSTPVGAIPELERRFGRMTVPIPQSATGPQIAEAVRKATHPRNEAAVLLAQRVAESLMTADRMAAEWNALIRKVARAKS